MSALATQYWHQVVELEKKLNEAMRLIRQLEQRNGELLQMIAVRDERIAALEEENRKLKGTGKKLTEMLFRPEERQKEEEKRGAKDGHKAFFRRKPKPEDVTERKKIECETCPDCGAPLGAPHSWRTRHSIDIPPPRTPRIIEWQLARYHCGRCDAWVSGQPEGLFGKSPFGINLILKVLDMKYRGKDTDDYIQETLKRWHGIDLSDGGIHAILDRAAELFGPQYEGIKQALREGKFIQADETGWRIEGENWYAWAFLNEEVTLFQIEDTRGGGVPKETLQGFHGVLGHDAYQGYNAVEGVEHAICGVHFLRHTHEMASAPGASEEAQQFHRAMVWFFRRARKAKKRCRDDAERLALHRRMHRALERYWKGVTYADPLVESTRQWWLADRGDQLLTFLKYEKVPFDNNAAERAIRPMVRRRKVTGGSRSERGAEREAINMSCITTLLKQGKDLFQTIPMLWRAGMASADS